ncbi:hypothetical protein RJ640_025724 [Escallonia rubra]|uniref:Pentatricopeptide repeat-containing protein n=1 Tax=Escallonia rubra TaxID=112253 RepID=A0AA88RVY8_9ASTE|nr:hypothetical protein RJ640_025724 [Escallonia rubra]
MPPLTPPSLRTSSALLPSLKPAEASNLIPTTQFNQQVKGNPCLSSGYDLLLLKSPPHLSEARRLHALLLVAGYFRPTATNISVLGSQLVNVYIRLGCLQHALLVFHHLPYKSNLSWNAILRGFVDAGHFSKAVELYHSMLRLGLVPDNYTYPLILKACSGLSALEEGRKVQDLIYFNKAYRNQRPNAYVGCALIDMFAKCGSLDEARMVFDDMPDKDLASWTAMICGTAHNGEWLQALSLFSRMRSQRIQPDAVILAALLPSCGRMEAKPAGIALQGCAVRSGFESDLFLTNALMDMYCKCGDTSEAFFVFVNMVCKDVISWSTLIAGYSQNSQYRESLEMYLEMERSGVKTNAIIAASVLPGFAKLKLLRRGKEMHTYILKQGFECDVVIGTALVDMYSTCGSYREAEHIFQMMSNRDITIWNSIIAGHASNEDYASAFTIFRRIWGSKLKPNFITLVSILPVCTKMGALKQGKEVHGYAIRSGLGMAISVQNSLIDMYCKSGYLEMGVKVFDHVIEKNVVTYNTIISAHGIHGYIEQALSFFDQMKAAKIRPNKVTFTGLLSACGHAGLVDTGRVFYNSMSDDYGLLPEMEHYSCMVDLLGRAGQLEDACNFIKRMSVEPDVDILGSLLAACRVHNKVELADLVGRQILRKRLKDSGCHILLSNIYASSERWEDASKVRSMIKEKGLVKKPGRSWIQIGHHICSFSATPTINPDFHKIEEIFISLVLEMKVGYVLDPSFLFHDHDVEDGCPPFTGKRK